MAGTMVAVGDDLSTLFWNPAGMAFQTDEGIQLMFGGHAHPAQTGLSAVESPVSRATATPPSQVEQTFVVPHIFLGIPINDRLEVSFAFYNPYGLGTEWEDDFLGNYLAKKTDLMVFDLGASMAYQISENFAFGLGVDYMTATIELTREVGLINPFNQQLIDGGGNRISRAKGLSSAWAWNAGILWKMGGGFSFGASYRSEFTINGDGNAVFHPGADRHTPSSTGCWAPFLPI